MKTYNHKKLKATIDHYIDNDIFPQTNGLKLRYDQLFWDDNSEHPLWPFHSYILQEKEEFRQLCYFILDRNIDSYLEVGIHTGVQLRLLHEIFNFNKVAAANLDEIYFPKIPSSEKFSGLKAEGVFDKKSDFYIGEFPQEIMFFIGNSQSKEYHDWRQNIGYVELTFIDADHLYHGVKKDFELNTNQVSYKYIAFHDIGHYNKGSVEVKKLWDQLEGNKLEFSTFTKPPVWMGIGIYWD